jgi:hypothetical protein
MPVVMHRPAAQKLNFDLTYCGGIAARALSPLLHVARRRQAGLAYVFLYSRGL